MKKLREILGEMHKKSDLEAIAKKHSDAWQAAKMRSSERDYHAAQSSRAKRLIAVRNGIKEPFKVSHQLAINRDQKKIAVNAQKAIARREAEKAEKKRKK